MNRLYFTILFIFCTLAATAAHIVGGEMIYEYLGPGASPNTKSYKITLRLFRDEHCTGCAAMPANVYIGIFSNINGQQYPRDNGYFNVPKEVERSVTVNDLPPCITNPPQLLYNVAIYSFTTELPDNTVGYTAAYQTCCRINPLANVFNQSGNGGTGSTYSCIIPGTNQLTAAGVNSSPQFFMGVSVICNNKPFTLDFSAQDPDGDELVYSFCEAYNGGRATGSNNINPDAPPYSTVPYINGFSAAQPLGNRATIDSKTGKITGIAPGLGEYVVCVCISEYRGGKLISTHRKDFIVNVNNCDFAGAELQPSYISCDDFNYTFQNLNTSPLNKTYHWDFGDNTTSTDPVATHTFAAAGDYNVTLTVNKGENCSSSTTSVIKVYPGFAPGFTINGICLNRPTQFNDTSKSRYGIINYWSWSFGDPASANNTSLQQNPTHTYAQTGTKNIQFIVGDTKGCMDTVYKPIEIIDKPVLQVAFKDTLICVGDNVQLGASGIGNFSWTPTGNISNANTATPVVNPNVTTNYIVELDDNGCKNKDSVQVRVVNQVTLQARRDTTICGGDPVQLSAVTNGFKYQWSPAATLNNPVLLRPVARPQTTTTYQITSFIGGCSSTDDVTVTVVPYPVAKVNADTVICYGTTAQLNGSIVGASFAWSPSAGLTNANTLTPLASPTTTTKYVLYVLDNQGCPKPGIDSVLVTVLPKINAFAGNDTTAVVGQPIQLTASGGTEYLWTPNTSLNNANVANPIGSYSGDIESIQYKVYVGNENGCIDSAYVSVKVFKTAPNIFVPTAFTPNSDGRNDVFRPIAAGISKMDYFRIYNRWGQLVFTTSTNGKGWDGRLNGKDQATGTYVWMIKGTDYTGKQFAAKGTVTLIR